MAVKLTIPDLGDFEGVEVIEIIASPGDVVAVEDPLITLETDKATMDVPAEQAGTIVSVDVNVGDRVSQGDVFVTIEPAAESATADEVSTDGPGEETQRMSASEIQAATQRQASILSGSRRHFP